MKFFCQVCGKKFERSPVAKRSARHCSIACKAVAMRKADDLEKLRELAESGRTLVSMASELGIRVLAVRASLRRAGVYDTWKRARTGATRKTIDMGLLLANAASGARLSDIAAEFNASRDWARRALVREGLYRTWCEHRYKKCASRRAGSSSANIASVANAGSGPSAGSALRTA